MNKQLKQRFIVGTVIKGFFTGVMAVKVKISIALLAFITTFIFGETLSFNIESRALSIAISAIVFFVEVFIVAYSSQKIIGLIKNRK